MISTICLCLLAFACICNSIAIVLVSKSSHWRKRLVAPCIKDLQSSLKLQEYFDKAQEASRQYLDFLYKTYKSDSKSNNESSK